MSFEIADNTYVVQGAMSLNDFNEYFDVELVDDGYHCRPLPDRGWANLDLGKSRLSCEVDSQKKHLILTNDKVKNGRVTKVKVKFLKSSKMMKKPNQKRR